MKKLITIIGIVCLVIITILNILYTANLDISEHITITNNSFIYILGIIVLGIFIFLITNMIDKKIYSEDSESKKKKRKIFFWIALSIYIVINIAWILLIQPHIVGDQIHACNLAQTFYNNNLEEFLPNMTYAGIPLSQYMQSYHQQISLSFVFSIFFRIINFDGIGVLRVLNVIGNIMIIVALYKISKQISKKYKINKVRLLFLILTFISLLMLSTFIYGDIPSLALCLFSVYFMMRYTETEKIKYPIYASIFTMIAYMMRMNSLIFIIATVIYLLFNVVKNISKKIWKENILSILIMIMYICISMIPSSLVQNYFLDKYGMDKTAEYPTISYFLMAMEESWRANGWYNEEIGEYALKNIEKAGVEYVDKIKDRLKYFSENKEYAVEFYIKKLASMWTENTYSAVRSNIVEENDSIQNITAPLTFYQKTLLIVMCVSSFLVLIQNRKNISIDIIFLITIFIGGFAFHILWEAKSRYIIPYIIVLIPISSIYIKKIGIMDKVKKYLTMLK